MMETRALLGIGAQRGKGYGERQTIVAPTWWSGVASAKDQHEQGAHDELTTCVGWPGSRAFGVWAGDGGRVKKIPCGSCFHAGQNCMIEKKKC